MYKYSVIIPTLNEEKNISKLLDSILRQTIKPLEIIVADKSTDQTPKILKSYKVKVVEGVNDYHVGRARNNAAKIATGKYLFFLDADNLLLSRDYIESVLKFMEIHNLGASHGTLVPDDAKYSSKVGYTLYNGIRKSSTYLKKVTTDVGSGIVVRRDVYEKVGGFREDITTNEDIMFLNEVIKKGYKYKISPFKIISSNRRFRNISKIALLGMIGFAILGTILVYTKKSKTKAYEKAKQQYWKSRDYTK